jgi:hypothetical protein
VTPIKKWSGKKPSIGHLRMFGCVAWAHISDNCRKKLDDESHSCIMMGYLKESKGYQLFDPVKQQINIWCNVIFDEKTSSLDLLNYPFGPPYSDPFGIVKDIGSIVPPISTSTSLSASFPDSIASRSTPTETVTSPNCFSKRPDVSLIPSITWWDVKMIEVVNTDVGDISTG